MPTDYTKLKDEELITQCVKAMRKARSAENDEDFDVEKRTARAIFDECNIRLKWAHSFGEILIAIAKGFQDEEEQEDTEHAPT